MKFTLATLVPSLLGGGGVLTAGKAALKKKADEHCKPKHRHLRVPKGHVAFKMRFDFPVYRDGELVLLQEGKWARFFGLEHLVYVSKLPQMHAIPEVSVVLTSGISFKMTPFLGYVIEDPEAAEFGVADWKKYLVDKATTLLNTRLGKIDHDKLLALDEEIASLIEELNKQVKVCGIKVDYIGFKDIVTDEIGKSILGQYALGMERVKVLEGAVKSLGEIDPLVAISILGGQVLATSQGAGAGLTVRDAEVTPLPLRDSGNESGA